MFPNMDSMVETVDGNSLITASLVSAITQADQSIRLVMHHLPKYFHHHYLGYLKSHRTDLLILMVHPSF